MVKRIVSIIFILLIFISPIKSIASQDKYIEDNAFIFSYDYIINGENKLRNLKQKNNIPVYIYTTTENLGSNVRENADSLLMDKVGKNKDGILLLIDFYRSEIWITVSGNAIDIIDDERQTNIIDKVVLNVRNNPNQVLDDYIALVEEYIISGPREGVYRISEKNLSSIDIIIAAIFSLLTFLISYYSINNKSKVSYSKYIFPLLSNMDLNFDVNSNKLLNTNKFVSYIKSNSSSIRKSGTSSTIHKTRGGSFSGKGRKF